MAGERLNPFEKVPRTELLGITITDVSPPDLCALLLDAASKKRRVTISFVNHHSLVLMKADALLKRDLNALDLVGADGVAVVWASRLLGRGLRWRVGCDSTAPYLVPGMQARNLRLYLFGASPGIAEAAAANLIRRFPRLQIAGTHHGYVRSPEEHAALIADINRSEADVLWVGLGAPLQERWIVENRLAINTPVMMTAGGLLDHAAERVDYYPDWVDRSKLNWLYRLYREPSRLWRRYSVEALQFAWMLLNAKLRSGAPETPRQSDNRSSS